MHKYSCNRLLNIFYLIILTFGGAAGGPVKPIGGAFNRPPRRLQIAGYWGGRQGYWGPRAIVGLRMVSGIDVPDRRGPAER